MKKTLLKLLVVCLMVGAFFVPMKTKANEITPYASNTQVISQYVTITNPINKGFDLTIYYKLYQTNDGLGTTTLSFHSHTSTSITSGYTYAPSKAMSAVGYSSNTDANKLLKITYAVKVYQNSVYLGTVDITITYKLNRTPTVSVG